METFASPSMSIVIPERVFYSLKILNTYFRKSTIETCLNGLALMLIHREINLDPDEVVNRFEK